MCKMEDLFKLNNNETQDIAEIDDKYDKIIFQPYDYYKDDDNKTNKLRETYIQVYAHLMEIDQANIEFYTEFIKPLHTVVLVLDDIMDSSELRWGIPCVHHILGVGRAVAMTDMSINQELTKMFNKSNQVGKLTLTNVVKLFQGQIMEIYWRDNMICPSEDDYLDMITKKTGEFFFTMSSFMVVFSKSKVVLDLNKLSYLLSIYYQIADDYHGLTSKVYCDSKGFCDDIREGKFTFPVIHAIKSRPEDTRILDILKMHTNDFDLKIKCVELLEEFGSIEYTKDKIKLYKGLIVEEVKNLDLKVNFEIFVDVQTLHTHDEIN